MAIKDIGFYDFSKGFEDLHTQSYREIIAGRGFTLDEARPAIETVAHIRKAPIEIGGSNQHPALAAVLADKGRYRDGYPV
jgi:UDP-N-acetyl-2-amino-2-deoxyglucuronate dehydrogenase